MDEMKITEAKLLRGELIRKLYLNYGTDIRISVLKNNVRSGLGLVSDQEIRKAIYYLGGEGKRYIHVELDKENWMDSMIWLTPAGINLAECDLEDVGVIYE